MAGIVRKESINKSSKTDIRKQASSWSWPFAWVLPLEFARSSPSVQLSQNLLPTSLPPALLIVIPGLVAVGAVVVSILGLAECAPSGTPCFVCWLFIDTCFVCWLAVDT